MISFVGLYLYSWLSFLFLCANTYLCKTQHTMTLIYYVKDFFNVEMLIKNLKSIIVYHKVRSYKIYDAFVKRCPGIHNQKRNFWFCTAFKTLVSKRVSPYVRNVRFTGPFTCTCSCLFRNIKSQSGFFFCCEMPSV